MQLQNMNFFTFLYVFMALTAFSNCSESNQYDKIGPICKVCHEIVNVIQKSMPISQINVVVEKIALRICLKQGEYDHQVCKGTIKAMSEYILQSSWKHYSDPHLICPIIKACPKQYEFRKLQNDIQQILKGKPSKRWEKPTKRKIMKIMHVSDLHPDLYYTVGAEANCSKQPVCCRVPSNYSISEQLGKVMRQEVAYIDKNLSDTIKQPAGYWGSIASCELPFQTFQLFLEDLKKMDLDLILWTGDNTPHDIWEQTRDYNLNYTRILTEMISGATNTKVIPTMGNHESWPVNVYDFKSDREDVFKGSLAESWRRWLDQDAYESMRNNGYFGLTIPPMNNLRVLSLNTQAGNDKNWFLLQDPTDPGNMLKWLETELSKAETQNYYVWIIGHVHPKSTLNEWIMRYNALIDRYSYNIRGQFFGHSHVDHFNFFPSFVNKGELSGYYMISPALTTATFKNPEYRILQIDYDTLEVLDYHQYMLNISGNPTKEDNPQFQLFYSLKQAYQLEDMELDGGISQFREKLEKSEQFQKKYSYFMNGGLHPGKPGRSTYCDTTTSPQFHAQCMNQTLKMSNFQKVAGPWKYLKAHQQEQ